jgi:hypothetical protein
MEQGQFLGKKIAGAGCVFHSLSAPPPATPLLCRGQQLGNSENVDIVLKNFFDLDLPAWNLSISRSFPRFLLMGVEP